MIQIKEYEPQDGIELTKDAIDGFVVDNVEFARYWSAICNNHGVAYSGFHNAELIGSGGIIFARPDVGNVWLILSRKMLKCKKTAFRSIKMMLEDYILPEVKFRKLRAISRVGFPASQRFLRHLGFKCKGKRNGYFLFVR